MVADVRNEEANTPEFCVNKDAQSNGDHEVHNLAPGACIRLPLISNRLALGNHTSCVSAVAKAKQTYSKSNGCYYCSPACHTS